jgi:hypothetical protein
MEFHSPYLVLHKRWQRVLLWTAKGSPLKHLLTEKQKSIKLCLFMFGETSSERQALAHRV